eukprot:30479-Pelagococcus_subviridis.AAC.3
MIGNPPSPARDATPLRHKLVSGPWSFPPVAPTAIAAAANAPAASPISAAAFAASRVAAATSWGAAFTTQPRSYGDQCEIERTGSTTAAGALACDSSPPAAAFNRCRNVSTPAVTRNARDAYAARECAGTCVARAATSAASPGSPAPRLALAMRSNVFADARLASCRPAARATASRASTGGGSPASLRAAHSVPHPKAIASKSAMGRETTAGAAAATPPPPPVTCNANAASSVTVKSAPSPPPTPVLASAHTSPSQPRHEIPSRCVKSSDGPTHRMEPIWFSPSPSLTTRSHRIVSAHA